MQSDEGAGFRNHLFSAHLSGYHRTAISLLERVLRKPTFYTVFILANVLEIQPENLIVDFEIPLSYSKLKILHQSLVWDNMGTP